MASREPRGTKRRKVEAQLTESPRDLKRRFDAAHEKGIDSMRRHDFSGVQDALVREREVIDVQKTHIAAARKRVKKLMGRRKPR